MIKGALVMATLMDRFATGTTKYFQPEEQDADEIARNLRDRDMQERLSMMVGLVAFLLPVFMLIGVARHTCFRDSISHFYYAQFLGSVFVGCLFFIGGFLLAYRGETKGENWGATIAGIGAFFVALFPTINNGCEDKSDFLSRVFVRVSNDGSGVETLAVEHGYFKLFEQVENWHAFGAGAVFLFLAVYCYFVLTRVIPSRHLKPDGSLSDVKRTRNIIYRVCGLTIFVCVAVLGLVGWLGSEDFWVSWNAWNLTFWFELIALWAFGLAWTVKGRALKSLRDTALT